MMYMCVHVCVCIHACMWCDRCVHVYVYLCVCVHLCDVYVVPYCACEWTGELKCVEASNRLQVYLYDSPYILRRCFSLNLKLCLSAVQSSDRAQGSPYTPIKVGVED